ncbi:hypothetical protein C3747_74g95 [Trypanosoma cruzi]|uniref:Uncharacterized protein n=1 Tax=Trypanosoma cruzi TaxID=5693 RepID=A0A2V2WML9_TRYCR|nr:hypothetical protein C3747_74g95 [Trypanosoma cruzi]
MADRAVVIFLFAQEKLLFRYPICNPFTLDANSQNTTVPGTHTKTHGKSSAVAVDTTTDNTITATAALHAKTTKTEASQQQKQQKQQPSTAAPAGVGVRHKPRNTKRLHPTPKTTTADSKQLSDNDGDGAAKSSITTPTALFLTDKPPRAGRRSSNNKKGISSRSSSSSASGAKEDDGTCVGVQTPVLVHLLRARFSSCTTIQFAGGTFLIYPLLPSSVNSRRLEASEAMRSHNFAAEDILVDMAHNDGDDENNEEDEGGKEEDEEEEGKRRKVRANDPSVSLSQGVVLVVAMSQPDREDGAIANLLQIFMNILVREELRSKYVTDQVLRMEHRIHAWEMGSDGDGNDASAVKHDASPCHGLRGGKRLSTSNMFAALLKDAELSLCKEISLLAQHITAAKINGKKDDGTVVPAFFPATHPPHAQRGGVGNTGSNKQKNISNIGNSISSGGGSNNSSGNVSSAASNQGGAPELLVRGLYSVPVASILGHRRPVPYHASAYVRQNPNYIMTLEDPCFVERLAKPYIEAVGWRASQLLPLSTIHTVLGTLPLPWRVGGLYRALELSLTGAIHQRQGMKQQQQLSLSAGSNSNLRLGWVRTEESFTMEGSNAFSLEDQNSRLDCDALVVEAVEFLRLSGVLAIDAEISVVFTHGDLLPEAGIARWSGQKKCRADASCPLPAMKIPPTTTNMPSHQDHSLLKPKPPLPVAPASMIGLLVFEAMQSSGITAPGSSGDLKSPLFSSDDFAEASVSVQTLTMMASTSSSPPVFPSNNMGGSDIPQLEVYCAWGNACTICEELASTPYAWRVGNSPVRLSFPFLAPAVADAAARRGRQGARLIDPECCRLMADQRPWFTRPSKFATPAALADDSPVQVYRHLTRGYGEGAGRKVKGAMEDNDGRSIVCCAAELGGYTKQNIPTNNEKFTAITPGGIPAMAREWLAKNCSAIGSRLAEALKQRQDLEEHAKKLTEQRRAAVAAAAGGETTAVFTSASGSNSRAQYSLSATQRYHKRVSCSPKSVPGITGVVLPLSPISLTPSHESSSSFRHHRLAGDGHVCTVTRLISTERVVPFEALMQFVFHHAVALLWGKPGIGVETLLYLLECNLRRLRPFLVHYAYIQQLTNATGISSDTASCSSAQLVRSVSTHSGLNSLNAFQAHPSSLSKSNIRDREKGKKKSKKEEEALSDLEQQLLDSYAVFTELSLMDLLKKLNGMTVEVVPTRLLLHTVVNAFADVLLIGRGHNAGSSSSSSNSNSDDDDDDDDDDDAVG